MGGTRSSNAVSSVEAESESETDGISGAEASDARAASAVERFLGRLEEFKFD